MDAKEIKILQWHEGIAIQKEKIEKLRNQYRKAREKGLPDKMAEIEKLGLAMKSDLEWMHKKLAFIQNS